MKIKTYTAPTMSEAMDSVRRELGENARRRGIGRALMEELFRRMQERKVRVIHLDVRIGNTPARNLYESLGFVQDGLRKGYYDLPKEDAVLMSRTDESVPKR